MARFAATGQIVNNANGYAVRVRVGNDRPTFAMAVRDEDGAAKRAVTLASIAKQLRGVASEVEIATLLTEAVAARNEKALGIVLEAVEAIASGTTTSARSAVAPTFAAFAEDWTSKKLHRLYPDHVRDKDADEDIQQLADYINPHIGHLHLPDVTHRRCGARDASAPRTARSSHPSARCAVHAEGSVARRLPGSPHRRESDPA